MTRDSQQSKAYEAEFVLRGFYDRAKDTNSPVVEIKGVSLTLPPEARYGSLESIQAYVDRVVALVGCSPIRVRERKGSNSAHYCCGEIAVHTGRSNWAMREIVILHEVAHHLSRGPAHGPKFVGAFIDLLSQVMGPEVGLALRLINASGGVKESA